MDVMDVRSKSEEFKKKARRPLVTLRSSKVPAHRRAAHPLCAFVVQKPGVVFVALFAILVRTTVDVYLQHS